MHPIFAVDWQTAFVPTVSLVEIVIRGTFMYLFLFFLMRVVLNRVSSDVGLADVLMIVLVADASQNAMASEYKSITEGVVLVSTLVFWNYMLDWLAYRIPFLGRLIEPPAIVLIQNGVMNKRNMRKELLSVDELMGQLRLDGVDNIADVKEARMESSGKISVVKKQESQDTPSK